jgi:hypothetical protein
VVGCEASLHHYMSFDKHVLMEEMECTLRHPASFFPGLVVIAEVAKLANFVAGGGSSQPQLAYVTIVSYRVVGYAPIGVAKCWLINLVAPLSYHEAPILTHTIPKC